MILFDLNSPALCHFTCSEPLLDEREAVPRTHQLDVAAGQIAALTRELQGQRGRLTGALRQLEPGQQGPHTWTRDGGMERVNMQRTHTRARTHTHTHIFIHTQSA